jgi:cob(I)alamin adenosyltransferase
VPPKKSNVYTRTGDKGTSSLYNGERRSKTDQTFDALGNSDEVNAAIGIAREYCAISGNGIDTMLVEIQCRLFDIGSAIATPIENSSQEKLAYVQFSPKFTIQLEKWIDELDSQLPPLKNFVIPSGGFSSVYLNLARTVCRRAERSVVPLVTCGQTDPEVGKYLNRLSDFLFVAGRFAAKTENKTEIIWQKPKIS